MARPWMRLLAAVALAVAAFAVFNAIAFFGGAYRGLLDPNSSAGTFERGIASISRYPADRRRDVLVLGDSRIYHGLDPRRADAAGGGFRFVDASVPGTDPRCWYFFDRAVNSDARRFRAVVIPVDAYADDTSALGSLDADDHPSDFHAIVFETKPWEIATIVRGFYDPLLAHGLAFDLALRGPLLRDDVQALLEDPSARWSAIAREGPDEFAPDAAHPLVSELSALHVDFAHDELVPPTWTDATERAELAKQILRRAAPSPSYAAYRRLWLGAIVKRYVTAHVPVVFVRIPTRPAHRALPAAPSGSLLEIAEGGAGDVTLLPQDAYVALERPELFADQDHLDLAGSRRFSALLGRDVARVLRGRAPQSPVGARRIVPFRAAPDSHESLVHTVVTIAALGSPLLFGSIDFFIFFALVLGAFYGTPVRMRSIVLLVASYYFYLRWNAWYLVFLVFLTVADYAIALRLDGANATRKRLLLGLGIASNLLFLATFKYANFFTGTVATILGRDRDPWILALAVPIGISFHTFQSISYLVDVASGRLRAQRRLLDYALYLAFFPQLLAGPIVRAERFFRELVHWRAPNADDVERGLREILLGLIKKIVFADRFARVADGYFAAPGANPTAVAAWSAAVAFALQIHFDFSGYSDIAIGTARLLGFDFPPNFARPYFAWSVTEFWRRWHISLSTWLRDYLYIPLGGSRAGRWTTYRNLLVTMLLGGLWHGANWTFVAWGAYHGCWLAIERACGAAGRPPSRFVTGVRIVATFVVVAIGWVLFRATTFGDAATVYRAMIAGGGGPWTLPFWPLVLLALACAIGVAQEYGFRWNWERRTITAEAALLATLAIVLEMASWPGDAAPFLYFKF